MTFQMLLRFVGRIVTFEWFLSLVFVFRFSGEGAWYMYQSQGIASLMTALFGSIDPSLCVLLPSKLASLLS